MISQATSDAVWQVIEEDLARTGRTAEWARLSALPVVCAWCKRARLADGIWTLEWPDEVIVAAAANRASHGICPDCAATLESAPQLPSDEASRSCPHMGLEAQGVRV